MPYNTKQFTQLLNEFAHMSTYDRILEHLINKHRPQPKSLLIVLKTEINHSKQTMFDIHTY